MLKNYFKIAIRNLLKHKLFSGINLFSLTLGLSCCLLISIYILHELSFDRYHANKDRIVRLASEVEGASYENGIAKVTFPWGETAKERLPEIEDMCRFMPNGRSLVRKDEDRYYESAGFFADSSAFKIFSWELLEGNPEKALTAPNSIVLSETLAEKYFPNGNAMGQTLLFDGENQYQVTGVMQDIPENSHFVFDFLISMNGYDHPDLSSWIRWNQFYTYLLLKPNTSREAIVQKFDAILDENLGEEAGANVTPLLQPITSIHLHSNLFREISTNSNVIFIYLFGAIALFILFIACLNFINLTTASATTRAKEVGVRKSVGASRKSLIAQFLTETLFMSFLAGVLSVVLSYLLLPVLNNLIGRNLEINWFGTPWLMVGLVSIILLTGLLSGSYPAFILSAFRTREAIQGQLAFSSNSNLRKVLVVSQFTIATFMIIAVLIMSRQLDYIQNKDLGFSKDQIIIVNMPNQEMIAKAEVIKNEFAKLSGVVNVSASANRPGGSDFGIPYQAVGIDPEEQPQMRCLVIDEDFLETYGMEIVAGRNFSHEMATDRMGYLINEEAARQLGWEDPLNHQFSMPALEREAAPILGVVKDFHFRSLHEQIAPIYFFYQPEWYSQFSIKLNTSELNSTLSQLEQVWEKFETNHPFEYNFFDEQFDNLHEAEKRTANVLRWFTLIAILITCGGLFGLSTYMAEQRTKEIGIRKVLGASVSSIVLLISNSFLWLLVFGFVISIPLAYYATSRWLESFAYRTELNWNVFALAGAIALIIGIATVSFQAIRAAVANPVDSLRSE